MQQSMGTVSTPAQGKYRWRNNTGLYFCKCRLQPSKNCSFRYYLDRGIERLYKNPSEKFIQTCYYQDGHEDDGRRIAGFTICAYSQIVYYFEKTDHGCTQEQRIRRRNRIAGK